MRFTIDDKHLVKWMRVKNLLRTTLLAQDVLTEDEVLMG